MTGAVVSGKPARRAREAAALLILPILAWIAYLPALHGSLLWDDDAHVTRPELRSLHGLHRIWFDLGATQQYYPLTHSAFWVEHRLWGDAPTGYHVVNVLLHACAAALVFRILRRLALPGAWLAALLFVVHPVHVESVAWITEQKNTLSAVFYLSSAWAYLRFDETRRPRWYAGALALFVLALASKSVTATLPAALLVVLWWKRGRLTRRDFVPLAPWIAVGAAAGIFTAWVERTLIGAQGAAFAATVFERVLLSGRAFWFYAGKLLWPARLAFIYPRWDVHRFGPGQVVLAAAVCALGGALWAIRGRARGPLAAFLFFGGTLFPVLGFFNVYPFLFSYVADHFQYLASLGIIAPASAGIALGLARIPGRARWAGRVAVVGLVGALTILSFRQSRIYADARTLYRATLERNPECWMALNNLGEILAADGRLDEAQASYEQALRLRPAYPEALNNLGTLRMAQGRLDEAIAQFDGALRIRPDFADGENNAGLARARQGRWPEAIERYERALALDAEHLEAHANLGAALLMTGAPADAIPHLERVVRERPERVEARFNLGSALLMSDRPEEAVVQLERTLALRPSYAQARYNLGIALVRLDRAAEAIDQFEQALALDPTYANCHRSLGDLLAAMGRTREASEHYDAARRLEAR